MMTFQIYLPSPALREYVRYYWAMQGDGTGAVPERILPVGCPQMAFHKKSPLRLFHGGWQPRCFVCGQTKGYTDVCPTGDTDMLVVVFHPHAARLFLHAPLSLFHDACVPMEETEDGELAALGRRIAGTEDNALCLLYIEQFLMRRLRLFPAYTAGRLSAVVRQINALPCMDVASLADTACLSVRQFNRVFTEYVGSSPKEFLRIVRMQRALFLWQQHPQADFVRVAYDCGFSDQSHMIKEFKLFSGYTPKEYLAACAPGSDYFSIR